jgi:DNA polymerase
VELSDIRAGQQYAAGPFVTTVYPSADFETFSEAGYRWENDRLHSLEGIAEQNRGLEVVGTRNYVLHPTFEILSLSYDMRQGAGEITWIPPVDLQPIGLCEVNPHPIGSPPYGDPRHPWELLRYIQDGGVLSGWNVGSFEFDVWNYYCVPKWRWPRLRPEQLICAMAKARANAYPGKLANSGKVMQLVNQKDADGDRLLKKFSVPRNPTKTDPRRRIRPQEDPVDGGKLYAYNRQDLRAEAEASLRCPDLSPDELEIWVTDQKINDRGLQVDLTAVENCISIVEQAYEKYNAEIRALTNGTVNEASEVEKIRAWCNGRGCSFRALSDDVIAGALALKEGYPKDVIRVLEIRRMLGAASVKKLWSFRAQATPWGRLHWLYSYYAARTGRWTGNGPQPQNLYKGQFKTIEEIEKALAAIATRCLELVEYLYGDPIEAVAGCLRSLIIAKKGHELICSDYSAIEGVVTAALAGEQWRLEVFRTHGMIYEASASMITGTPFDEFVRHKKQTGQHHPLRAKIGKFAELASGFGGWIGAWKNFGADEFLSDDEIKQAILKWREASPSIVEFWGGQTRDKFRPSERPELFGLEGAAISAVKHPGLAFPVRDIWYQVFDDVLYCRLPSGRFLTYHKPRLTPSSRDYASPWEYELSYEGWNSNPKKGAIGWVRMFLYGGILTENVVQAVARDIQAKALVRLERAGYAPVLHTHDEIAGEVREGWGSIVEFEAIMSATLPWMYTPDGLPWPIKAKGGWRGFRYRKD